MSNPNLKVVWWLVEVFATSYGLTLLLPKAPGFYVVCIALVLVLVLNCLAYSGKKSS
jgi:hypothetical protein